MKEKLEALLREGTAKIEAAASEAELQEVYAKVAEQWISETGGEAQAVYDAAVELVAKYSK